MAIEFPSFEYGRQQGRGLGIGQAMRKNFGGGNLFQNLMSIAGSGGTINPMGMIGFGPLMKYGTQPNTIRDAYGANAGAQRSRGGAPIRPLQYGTPAGEVTHIGGNPGFENYMDEEGAIWRRGENGWIRISSPSGGTGSGGIDDRGGSGRQDPGRPPQGRTR